MENQVQGKKEWLWEYLYIEKLLEPQKKTKKKDEEERKPEKKKVDSQETRKLITGILITLKQTLILCS